MFNSAKEQRDLEKIIAWGQGRDSVRAMIMTSSRSSQLAPIDLLSDYDIILIVTDIHPYVEARSWLEDFGKVLALYQDPILIESGFEKSGNIVQFEDGLKIDFTLIPIGLFQHIVSQPQLPDEYDAGYRILLDKDHLTYGLKPPTYQAFIPSPPSQAQYLEHIEVFFVDVAYMGKFLWRDDLVAAKFILESMMKLEHLIPMLEWHMEIEHQWKIKPGPHGRRLKQHLRADLWADLEATYTGANIEDNWKALYKTIELLRRVAIEVGNSLGFTYPQDLHDRNMSNLRKIQSLDPDAKIFPP